MKAVELAPDVFGLIANIGNQDLFEGIWPIPHGVSLNSYVVKGEKTALIDMVKDWEHAVEAIDSQMKEVGTSLETVDYLILNHMEPDHTGWLKEMKEKNPDLQIYCSKKAVPLISAFYGIDEGVTAVGSGDELDLGNGKVLAFEDTPNIHWPETMMTFEPNDGILFSCDAFGSFGQLGEHVFDDQLTDEERTFYAEEAERYYANIVSTFSAFVERGIKKLADHPVRIIAPSHGVIWRDKPEEIVEHYQKLASYKNGPAEQEVTVVWSSMYGNTQALLDSVLAGLESEGVKVHVHRVPQEHVSFVLASAWRSSGIIIGTPTYEYKMFPPMYAALDVMDRSHVLNRKAFRFGSYGWSGGAQKQYDEFIKSMKWDCAGSVEYQGAPSDEDKQKAYDMAVELAKEVKAWV